jgi:hypothetical protein
MSGYLNRAMLQAFALWQRLLLLLEQGNRPADAQSIANLMRFEF